MYKASMSIRRISTINLSKDHYKTLGIATNATHKEIRHAYLTLAKKFHPDSPTGKENAFKEIGEAYEILGNKRTRHEYDSKRMREKGSNFMSKRSAGEDNRDGVNFRSAEMHEDYRYDDPFVNSGLGMRYSYSQYKKDYHDLYFSNKRPKNTERMKHYSSYTPGSSYQESSSSKSQGPKEKTSYAPLVIIACGFYIMNLLLSMSSQIPAPSYYYYKNSR